MLLSYGHEMADHGDPLATVSREAMYMLGVSAVPGKFLVDTIPIRESKFRVHLSKLYLDVFCPVRYVPEWFPGAGFQKLAHTSRELTRKMRFEPLDMVKHRMVRVQGEILCIYAHA